MINLPFEMNSNTVLSKGNRLDQMQTGLEIALHKSCDNDNS